MSPHTLIILLAFTPSLMAQEAVTLLSEVDANLTSANRVMESSMTIHGKRTSRTITAKTMAVGTTKSFTEYLSPAAEKGTKMLKLDKQLWIYSPATDRTVQLSGHLLRQSVMGSDLSYEEMMDDRKLSDIYTPLVIGRDTIDNRPVVILQLTAVVDDVAYPSQKMWVDAQRHVPLRQEFFAKSGQLLKRMDLKEVVRIDSRWFPLVMIYKDMLKGGKGTEFRVTAIRFNQEIPDYIFTKAALKR